MRSKVTRWAGRQLCTDLPKPRVTLQHGDLPIGNSNISRLKTLTNNRAAAVTSYKMYRTDQILCQRFKALRESQMFSPLLPLFPNLNLKHQELQSTLLNRRKNPPREIIFLPNGCFTGFRKIYSGSRLLSRVEWLTKQSISSSLIMNTAMHPLSQLWLKTALNLKSISSRSGR